MHYSCLILTDDHKTDIEAIVDKLLAPYSEDITVAPYDRDCVCITNKRIKKLIADSDTTCPSCNGKGSYPSTYNPNAKWDCYQIGGRWNTMFGSNVVQVKQLLDSDSEFQPSEIFALVEPDGSWHQAQPLFDICEKQAAEWPGKLIAILTKHEKCKAILCDLHI